MAIFVDTSALFAGVSESDPNHRAAVAAFRSLTGERLVTHNYVLVEAITLVQRRFGVATVSRLQRETMPVIELVWVERDLHDASQATHLADPRRELSFVDRVSFELMRREAIETAFAFDDDFAREGFSTVP